MSKVTQKEIMEDVLSGLFWRYEPEWHFQPMKVKGIKHVIRGDNKLKDLHCTFAIPMIHIQESQLDYWSAIDLNVFKPIKKLMDEANNAGSSI